METIEQLTHDTTILINKEGFHIQCMDTNHVALVSLNIPPRAFNSFECKDEKTIGLSLTSFMKILKCAQPKDDFEMCPSDETDDVIFLEFSNEKRTFSYDLKLLDLPYSPLNIPSRDDDAIIHMNTTDFREVIADLGKLGTEVAIEPGEDEILFVIESDEGKGQFEIKYDDDVKKIALEEEISQLFALKYLAHFAKACTFCDLVELRMKDGNPLMVEFPLPKLSSCMIDTGGSISYGSLLFFLAPKIDED
jgi:proliferating cell nuclear antigen